jgi:DNA invertase Pin-like site-specific DNA recombinase
MTTTAALYARKSADESLSPRSEVQTQVKEIHAWAEKNDFEIVAEFVDDAQKGWDMTRPQLQAMMTEALKKKERRFQSIIVADWDRFARKMSAASMIEELESVGVEIISVRGGRARTRNERIGRDASLFVAQIENEIRGGHILGGQIRWASEGYSPGGKVPFGYRKSRVEDARGNIRVRYEVDTATAAVVRLIFSWFASGTPLTEITRRLNERGIPSPRGKQWSRSTVFKILQNPRYTGDMIFNRTRVSKRFKRATPKPKNEWIICKNAHEAIIPKEIADAILIRLGKISKKP